MQHGSLQNQIYGNAQVVKDGEPLVPEVGMGATKVMWTDRHAGTIIEVAKNKKGEVVGFTWQRDKATRSDKNGMSDAQSYDYEPNPNGEKCVVTLRKNGRWVRKGEGAKGTSFLIGSRREYHDFSF